MKSVSYTHLTENKDTDTKKEAQNTEEKDGKRTIVDSMDREVEIPAEVDSIVCLNVTSLRYTCYMPVSYTHLVCASINRR